MAADTCCANGCGEAKLGFVRCSSLSASCSCSNVIVYAKARCGSRGGGGRLNGDEAEDPTGFGAMGALRDVDFAAADEEFSAENLDVD